MKDGELLVALASTSILPYLVTIFINLHLFNLNVVSIN